MSYSLSYPGTQGEVQPTSARMSIAEVHESQSEDTQNGGQYQRWYVGEFNAFQVVDPDPSSVLQAPTFVPVPPAQRQHLRQPSGICAAKRASAKHRAFWVRAATCHWGRSCFVRCQHILEAKCMHGQS